MQNAQYEWKDNNGISQLANRWKEKKTDYVWKDFISETRESGWEHMSY